MSSRNTLANRIANLPAEKRGFLERKIKQQGLATPSVRQAITRKSDSKPAPLSFAQQRLWFLDVLEPQSVVYNIPHAVRLEGALNVEALRAALDTIVARHEVLRTNVVTVEEEPVQLVRDSKPILLSIIDLTGRPISDQQAELERVMKAEAQGPFNLVNDLMLRATLVRLSVEEQVLLLTTHHIAGDAWSVGILWRELTALYEAYSKGRPNPLPELPIQYADYAVWQRNWFQGEVLATQLSYWKTQLANVAVLQLPADRSRPAVQSYRGAQQSFELPQNLFEQLRTLSRKEGTTLFMTLLAAFQVLLYRYTGQEDIAVGSPIAGRTRSELEELIGFFVNTLVLRTDLSGNPTFRELLARVRDVALEAYEHQDLPFERLVEELNPERNLSHTPLFQVMFAFQNVPGEAVELSGLSTSRVEINNETAKFDLSLATWDDGDALKGSVEYSTDLFDAATIQRMLGHFRALIENIVSRPDQPLSELSILSEAERYQLLVEWNNTRTANSKDKCFQELFEQQVERTPNALAVVFEDQQFTYRELNQRANQLAHFLRKLGVGPDVLVGIYLERSLEMIIGLLGILKAGGAYVPLDPECPEDRLEYMLEDTGATVLLTQAQLTDRLPKYAGKKLALDNDWGEITRESGENPHHEVTSVNLAYVIYTSGSTGKPKGVLIEHGGLTNYLNYCVTAYPFQEGRGSLVHSSFAFDATITGLYAPLLVGRAVYLLPKTDDLETLAKMLRRLRDFSVVKITPLHLALLSQQIPAEEAKDLTRCFVIGGENLVSDQISFWQTNAPATLLFNEYGPTENVVGCIVYEASKWRGSGSVPIGRAIPNTSVYVLDQQMQPVPIGVLGELYLGGAGVARGYLNRPELTAERFIADPFRRDPRARLYRTGDVARYLPDGSIEFIGRLDHQVKIRGYRIELGEIESVLCQHPAIGEAVVLAQGEISDDNRLVGYFVSDQQPSPTINELRNFLKQKLPDYMVPSAFVCLDALPLTPNGKVDRKALPAPDGIRSTPESAFIAPRDDVEYRLAKIWESVLGTQPIGIKDNFFDLGGHSLLAVKLLAEIEKVSQRKLPLSILFRAPTLEQLASIVRVEADAAPDSTLVPIHPHGSKPPLFLVHGADGGVFNFADLARYMDADQPLYGLKSPGFDGEQTPFTQIETIASHYIDEIHRVQPEGPYLLVGFCMGGTVAFEMSQQLLAQGQNVALLVLMDSLHPVRTYSLRYIAYCIKRAFNDRIVHRYSHHVRNLKQLKFSEWPPYLLEKLSVAKTLLVSAMSGDTSSTKADSLPAHRAELIDANANATRNYEPKPYPGRITLFLAHDSPVESSIDRRLAWGELARGGAEVHTISGDHSNMVWDPHAQGLAAKLRDCIDRASKLNDFGLSSNSQERPHVRRNLR